MKKIEGGPRPARSKGGEQFADPLAWNPDSNRAATPAAPRGGPGVDPAELREKEINRRIVQEYGRGPLDSLKPLAAVLLVGAIVWTQVDRSNAWNAAVYTAMAMSAAGSIYVMIARDTLPPLVSMLFRGFFILGVIAVGAWFVMNHADTFSRPLDKEKSGARNYREVEDPTAAH